MVFFLILEIKTLQKKRFEMFRSGMFGSRMIGWGIGRDRRDKRCPNF
jgi:hypothetical protein